MEEPEVDSGSGLSLILFCMFTLSYSHTISLCLYADGYFVFMKNYVFLQKYMKVHKQITL